MWHDLDRAQVEIRGFGKHPETAQCEAGYRQNCCGYMGQFQGEIHFELRPPETVNFGGLAICRGHLANGTMANMLNVIAIAGILIVLACAYGSINPPALFDLLDRFANPAGYAAAIALRVVLGIVAILVAPDSLSPVFLQIVGVISVAAAIGLLLMGINGYKKLINWFRIQGPALHRLALTGGLLFGSALIWVSGIL